MVFGTRIIGVQNRVAGVQNGVIGVRNKVIGVRNGVAGVRNEDHWRLESLKSEVRSPKSGCLIYRSLLRCA
ncbi:hypothetical protein OC25_26540 [Pedobacter kyungheensis]|uniref:Uncharacterized protein n=1 Tax=Pedobacter kyungheensis TaxID=1069985 RepID=A0A0C1FJ56_9SPHI|nr:hypothetical protein OC25_26540 [Pedobacter kyungheensis]